MSSTPTYGYRYPALTDAPNVPLWVQNLAEDAEDETARIDANSATTNSLLLGYAAPTQLASGTLGTATSVTVMSVSISDPGFTYRIKASGSVGWGVVAGSIGGNLFECSITLDSTVYNTGVISKGFVLSHSISAGFSQPTCQVGMSVTGNQTGAHTMRLIARNSGATSYTIPAANLENTFTVCIVRV